MSNTFSTKMSGRVSSRGWAIALGIGAIVLATILLIVYLDRYRARVSGRNAPTPVLVAKQTIPAGTPGTIVTGQAMYAPTTLPKKEVEEGAIADPTYLTGRAAAVQILPGQQITAADFAATTSTTVDSQIVGKQRAISFTIDAIHGSTPQLKAGDKVDIFINKTLNGKESLTLFRSAVTLLTVPSAAGGQFMFRVDAGDVANYMWVIDHHSMWFVIRPAANAKPTKKTTANEDTILK